MDTHDVGRQLRQARIAAGLTMRELAKRSRVSHQLVEKIEAGQNTTLKTLERLSGGAGASLVVRIERPPSAPRAVPPADRLAVATRILAVLPRLPDTAVDVLLEEIALWETEYPPQG
jgi:transcriptional regulator with XRE-family HTH domain